jgi:DNA-binding winged helix-turn-helix (wHTH) protein
LRAGWGVNVQTVESYGLLGPAIHRLRAKLGEFRESKRAALLVTVRNRGYKIAMPDETTIGVEPG